MTRKEFEAYRLSVEKEQFNKHTSDPLDYGVQRIEFRRQKLKKLINAGKNIDSKTIQAKIVRWKRQLDRLEKSETRLKGLMTDLSTSKLQIHPQFAPTLHHERLPARVN